MNIEDIKVGETYNVRVTVEGKDCNGCWLQARTGEQGCTLILRASETEAFSPISPENGIKNTELAPKYDPCRKFRKGDRVRVTEWNGRLMFSEHGKVFKCSQNEHKNGLVPLKMDEDDISHLVHACHLELVTPVEEMVPYFVEEGDLINEWCVCKRVSEKTNCTVTTFSEFHPNAKAAAEAECARLNAEYRKEMEK